MTLQVLAAWAGSLPWAPLGRADRISVIEAACSGLSCFPHVVIDGVFNFSFLVEPKSIPSAAPLPVDQATGRFPIFLR